MLIGTLLRCLIAIGLVAGGGSASAFTLGRIQGVPLLGRPLDLVAQLQIGAGEEAVDACFDASVQFGDSAVDASKIRLNLISGSAPGQALLRIRSSVEVVEPTIFIKVRVSCGHTAERSYVLLSEVAPDSGIAATTSTNVATPTTAASPATPANAVAAAATASAAPAALNTPTHRTARLQLLPPTTRPTAASVPPVATAQSALDRLQARVNQLEQALQAASKSGNAASSPVQASGQVLPQVAPSQSQVNAQLQAMQTQLQGVQAVTQKNQQNLMALTSVLEQDRDGGRSNSVLYGILALLTFCVAGLGALVLRGRSELTTGSPWWSAGQQSAQADAESIDKADSAAEAVAKVASPPMVRGGLTTLPSIFDASAAGELPEAAQEAAIRTLSAKIAASADSLDIDLSSSIPGYLARADAGNAGSVPVRRDFGPTNSAMMRALDTKDMHDVRQQAEFFMALGQHDKAVKVLETSVKQSEAANPLVYLDLLKVFYLLDRREEFDRYRTEFNYHFTGNVPTFNNFMQEGRGLESYRGAMREIISLWGTPDVIDFLELCMVRTSDGDSGPNFDLEAFRDLLLLHGVTKRLDQLHDSDIMPFSASRLATEPQPEVSAAADDTEHTAASVLSDRENDLHEERATELAGARPEPDERASVDLAALADVTASAGAQGTPAQDAHAKQNPNPDPSAGHGAEGVDIDLELEVPNDDLIDFDLSGYSHLHQIPRTDR